MRKPFEQIKAMGEFEERMPNRSKTNAGRESEDVKRLDGSKAFKSSRVDSEAGQLFGVAGVLVQCRRVEARRWGGHGLTVHAMRTDTIRPALVGCKKEETRRWKLPAMGRLWGLLGRKANSRKPRVLLGTNAQSRDSEMNCDGSGGVPALLGTCDMSCCR